MLIPSTVCNEFVSSNTGVDCSNARHEHYNCRFHYDKLGTGAVQPHITRLHAEIPALYFKRDAMVHQGLERKVQDPLAIRMFFYEMTFNVINSIYPCTLDEAVPLAAIHLHIACGNTAAKGDIAYVCIKMDDLIGFYITGFSLFKLPLRRLRDDRLLTYRHVCS